MYLIVKTVGLNLTTYPDLASDYSSCDQSEQDFPRSFNSGPGLRDHPSKRPRFQNQLETIIAPQEMDDIGTRKAEVLNSLMMKITANENNINDTLQTFR